MKLFRFSFLLAVVPLCASAATLPLAPTSTWAYQAQYMGEGDLFSSTYTATANGLSGGDYSQKRIGENTGQWHDA